MSAGTPQAVPIHTLPPVHPPEPPQYPPPPPQPPPRHEHPTFTYMVSVTGPSPTSGTFPDIEPAIEYVRRSLHSFRANAERTGDTTPATATISATVTPGQPERMPPTPEPVPVLGRGHVGPPGPPAMAHPEQRG